MEKEASLYIKPSALSLSAGDVLTITVRARLRSKVIDHVDLYLDGIQLPTRHRAPYVYQVVPSGIGPHELRAVLTATDGTRYERYSFIEVKTH